MDHLRQHQDFNAQQKTGMMAGLEDWRRNASQADQQHLSHLMSQAHASNRPGSKAARDDRRAAIMMGALAHPNDRSKWSEYANNVNNGQGLKTTALDHAMPAYDTRLNEPANIEAKKQQLMNDPKTFLQHHPIQGVGGKEGGNNDYKMYAKNGIYRLDNTGAGPAGAHHVMSNVGPLQAKGYNGMKDNVGQLPGTSPGPGKNMLATTEFTGCTYAFQKSPAGGLTAAHINPSAGPDGNKLPEGKYTKANDVRTRLNEGNAGFAGAPNNQGFKAYGPLADNAPPGSYGYNVKNGEMNILGVKQGDGFKVYSQQKNPNTGALTVTEL
jgi:hypothetical protein